MDLAWTDMVTVGRIVRPHGHRGQVVVAPETDFGAERFGQGAVVYVQRAGAVEPLRVTASREQAGRWIVGFDAVPTMNDAEALRGGELRIEASAMRALDGGRFYVHDLVGCRVEDVAGRAIGTVIDVQFAPASPLLVVRRRGGEVLVPFVDAICRRVDPAARLIAIDPPGGLVDDDR